MDLEVGGDDRQRGKHEFLRLFASSSVAWTDPSWVSVRIQCGVGVILNLVF